MRSLVRRALVVLGLVIASAACPWWWPESGVTVEWGAGTAYAQAIQYRCWTQSVGTSSVAVSPATGSLPASTFMIECQNTSATADVYFTTVNPATTAYGKPDRQSGTVRMGVDNAAYTLAATFNTIATAAATVIACCAAYD